LLRPAPAFNSLRHSLKQHIFIIQLSEVDSPEGFEVIKAVTKSLLSTPLLQDNQQAIASDHHHEQYGISCRYAHSVWGHRICWYENTTARKL
jgi:hypothetical protein